MQKQNFEKFYAHTCAYDFRAAISRYAHKADAKSAVVSLYLSCEENSFIEYGDFLIEGFAEEFNALLVADGYLDSDGGIADKVGRILRWQVWVNFIDDGRPRAGVHLFDFTDSGTEEINEFQQFSQIEP
ncbi:MAG: hypothetical protein IKM65_05720 [Bacteroidaceae bacterium]|nr:hypothetical protein [Bacteroidaceae bacterium]